MIIIPGIGVWWTETRFGRRSRPRGPRRRMIVVVVVTAVAAATDGSAVAVVHGRQGARVEEATGLRYCEQKRKERKIGIQIQSYICLLYTSDAADE